MRNTIDTQKNNAAATATRNAIISEKEFVDRVIAQAEKEVRIRTIGYDFLSDYDRKLILDSIVGKAARYFGTYDPSKCNVEGIVYRIAHNVVCDHVNAWMRHEARTRSLDGMLGWTGESVDDSDSNAAPKAIAQEAAEQFSDYEAEADREMSEWASHVRRVLRTLSVGDQRIIAMLEREMTRDEMATELDCTRDALDKRVFDTRRRVQKALGCRVVRSRKVRRETADSISVDLPVFVSCSHPAMAA